MDNPNNIPSNAIFTDDDNAMDNIGDIRTNSDTPLVIRKNDPVIRVVLPSVFVESLRLPTSTNVEKVRVSVKRPSDSTLKPINQGRVGHVSSE